MPGAHLRGHLFNHELTPHRMEQVVLFQAGDQRERLQASSAPSRSAKAMALFSATIGEGFRRDSSS